MNKFYQFKKKSKSYYTEDHIMPEKICSKILSAKNIYFLKSTKSTMIYGRWKYKNTISTPALFIANKQTKGYGRFNRSFFSPKGQIYMTLVIEPDKYTLELPMYTILTSVSVALAMDKLANLKTKIKWVNDIYLNGKKICGILSEGIYSQKKNHSVIFIGIGINFSTKIQDFPIELRKKVTSIYPHSKPSISRNKLIKEIWKIFFQLIKHFPKNKNKILKIYREKSFILGKQISFTKNGIFQTGMAKKITTNGELIVEILNKEKTLSSGEIKLNIMD